MVVVVVRDTSVSDTVLLPLRAMAIISNSSTTAPITHAMGFIYHADISGPVVVVVVVVWLAEVLDSAAPPSCAIALSVVNASIAMSNTLLLNK